MSNPLQGTCLCGASSFAAGSLVSFTLRCYCTDCQYFSGANSLPHVAVPAKALTSSGPINTYTRTSASGNDQTFSFCATCGSSLYKSSTMAEGLVFLCAGSLTQPPTLDFDRAVHTDSARPWSAPVI